MHAPTLFVTAVALLSSVAAAQERPKFYFPRQVKREVSNNTISANTTTSSQSATSLYSSSTSSTSLYSSSTSLDASSTSLDASSTSLDASSTTRDVLGDLFATLTGGGKVPTKAPVLSSVPLSEVVKTVIISNTVYVANGVTSTLSPIGLVSTPSTSARSIGSATSSILIESDTSSTSNKSDISSTSNKSDISSTSIKSDISSTSIKSDISSTSIKSDTDTSVLLPTAGSTGGAPLVVILPTTSPATSTVESTVRSIQEGITFGPSGVVSLTSGPTPTLSSASEPIETSETTALDTATGISFSFSGSGTGTAPPVSAPTSTGGALELDTLLPSSALSSIFDGVTGSHSTGIFTSYQPIPTSTATSTGSSSDLESMLSSVYATPTPSSETGSTNASQSTVTTDVSSSAKPTYLSPTGTGYSDTNSTFIVEPTSINTSSSASTTIVPTTTLSSLTTGNGTSVVLLLPTTVLSSKVVMPATTILPAPTTIPFSKAPETLEPTGTDAAATEWVVSSIYLQPVPTGTVTSSTSTMASGIPTDLPQIVAPSSGVPTAPADNTLIQIGFLYPLNYQFVVANSMSSAQIFMYLPKGIAYGLGLNENQVIMHSLIPYDTTTSLGYITTLALAYIPSGMVSKLSMTVHTPLSPLYQNPNVPVSTIMSHINPAIPVQFGGGLDGAEPANTGSGGTPSPSAGVGDGGVFKTESQDQTSSARGMTAGIATGAVVAAAAYGAGMFFIARRYKKRRLAHRRQRSVMNPAEMAQAGGPALTGGAMMSGGRQPGGSGPGLGAGVGANDRHSRGSGKSNGNSARTAQISAPMMAENSLGWN